VVAVVAEEEDRPDDEDQRVDLQVVREGKEAGREMRGIDDRQEEITDEEGGEKRHGGQDQIDPEHDLRYETRLLLEHQ
jgi:hypothetical protein